LVACELTGAAEYTGAGCAGALAEPGAAFTAGFDTGAVAETESGAVSVGPLK
jgi:hypothetical protein